MADGEVEVAVRAEGVDEAAADMGGDGDGDGGRGGRGGRGGDGGLSTAIRGGIVGGLISSALEPLLKVLDPVLQILQAFVAPLAVLLLRILTPVLRLFLRFLPVYLDKFEEYETLIASVITGLFPLAAFLPTIVNFVSNLPGKLDTLKSDLKEKLKNLPGKIRSKLDTLKDDIVEALGDLPSNIASALFGGGGENDLTPQSGLPGRSPNAVIERVREETPGNDPVEINIRGGLAPLFRAFSNNPNVDIVND